jgi:hypothetical protein
MHAPWPRGDAKALLSFSADPAAPGSCRRSNAAIHEQPFEGDTLVKTIRWPK